MSAITICETLKRQLDTFRPFAPETLKSLRDYYRVGLTYTSNALEGNTLTESETKIVLENGLTVQGKPLRDVYEAQGHAEAYDYLDSIVHEKSLELDEVLKLHELFYRRIDPAQAGRLRKVQVFISGSHYSVPTPNEVPTEMIKFLQWLKKNEKSMHPVILSAEVHRRFVYIHPFVDGNGRVARLLMNFVLLRHGYPVTVIPPILRSQYIAWLEKGHTSPVGFQNFIAEREVETLRELIRLLGGSAGAVVPLSMAVEKLLQYIKAHPGSRTPVLAEAIGKSRSTTERYLQELHRTGKIEFRGAPKTGGYFPKEN